jgi:hypothetical protein
MTCLRTGDVYSRLFGKFGNKMKKVFGFNFKDLYKVAFDLYVAEDDIWKVYSTFSEFDNYKNLYTNAVKSGKLKNMPTDLEIMKQATKIVRDTLPNYAYVGDFIKSMRRTPLGNFMSWPASVIRSGLKTFELAQKEIKDPILTFSRSEKNDDLWNSYCCFITCYSINGTWYVWYYK